MKYLIAFAVALASAPAAAHDAPQGWSYDISCCSAIDCREIKSSDVGEVWNGYLIKISKMQEIVPYGSSKVKDSPDGNFHWCSFAGRDDGKTICLYVPPRGM